MQNRATFLPCNPRTARTGRHGGWRGIKWLVVFLVSALLITAPGATAAAVAINEAGLQAQLSGPEQLAESQARAVSWYAEEHHVSIERAREVLALQAKADGLQGAMRDALGVSAYAGVWFDDNNNTNQVIVDVGPGADLSVAESVLRQYGIGSSESKIVQKSWNETELMAEATQLDERFKSQIEAGVVRIGIAADANVQIMVASSASATDRNLVATSSADKVSPVTVNSATPVFKATPTYESPGYGSPLIGGMFYENHVGYCSVGFYAKSPVNSETYFLTAGHCATASGTDYACKSAGKCSVFGKDIGGWIGTGGDYGLMIDTRGGEWPPYPAFIDWSCCSGTLPVYGATSPTIGETVCHTGYASAAAGWYTTCGSVNQLNVEVKYTSGAKAIEDELVGSGLCVHEGDSGGPVFDPYNAYAKGIMDAADIPSGQEGECGKPAFSTDAALAASNMGVTIAIL